MLQLSHPYGVEGVYFYAFFIYQRSFEYSKLAIPIDDSFSSSVVDFDFTINRTRLENTVILKSMIPVSIID